MWKVESSDVQSIHDRHTTLCKTTHLTSFVLILDVTQNRENLKSLQLVTWIGCGVSLAGMTISVVSILLIR